MVRLLSLKNSKTSNIAKYSIISILYHHKNLHQQNSQGDTTVDDGVLEGRLFQVD